MSKVVVLSKSLAVPLSQVGGALEIWLGGEVVLLETAIKPEKISDRDGKDGRPQRKIRNVSIVANFREKGYTRLTFKVKCSLSVFKFFNDSWFIEQKPIQLFINDEEYLVVWEEPTCSVADLVKTTIANKKTEVSWTGIAHNERWHTEPKGDLVD